MKEVRGRFRSMTTGGARQLQNDQGRNSDQQNKHGDGKPLHIKEIGAPHGLLNAIGVECRNGQHSAQTGQYLADIAANGGPVFTVRLLGTQTGGEQVEQPDKNATCHRNQGDQKVSQNGGDDAERKNTCDNESTEENP